MPNVTQRVSTLSPWCTPDDLPDLPPELVGPDTVADRARAAQMASDILFSFTKRRFPGVGVSTIRPGCRHYLPMISQLHNAAIDPSVLNIVWRAAVQGGGGFGGFAPCGCRLWSEFRLPYRPVQSVSEVIIDGEVLDPSKYEVQASRWLVRLSDPTSGTSIPWPWIQRFDRPTIGDNSLDTWQVTLHHGVMPPSGGDLAAASLGRELLMAFKRKESRLPKRITNLSRQGVTLGVLDPLTLFANGQTGLPEVDLWVAGINQRRSRAVVVNPGSVKRSGSRRVPTTGS